LCPDKSKTVQQIVSVEATPFKTNSLSKSQNYYNT